MVRREGDSTTRCLWAAFQRPGEGPFSCLCETGVSTIILGWAVPDSSSYHKGFETSKRSPNPFQHIHRGPTLGEMLLRGCSYITRKGISWVQRGSSFSLTAASELSRAPAPQWCADGETGVYPVSLLSLSTGGDWKETP